LDHQTVTTQPICSKHPIRTFNYSFITYITQITKSSLSHIKTLLIMTQFSAPHDNNTNQITLAGILTGRLTATSAPPGGV